MSTNDPTKENNPQMNFDPMTGEPIANNNSGANPQMNSDPMTGEPIANNNSGANPQMNFDPMTGEPIANNNFGANSQMNFDPMTGEPIGSTIVTKPSKKGKIILACVGIVAVIACILFAASHLFVKTNKKILKAAINTIQPDRLASAVSIYDLSKDGKYTMTIDGEGYDVKANITYAIDLTKKLQTINAKIGYNSLEATLLATMDEKEIELQIPELIKKTFVYNYTEEKSGLLFDLAAQEGIDLAEIDKALAATYSTDYNSQKEAVKELQNTTLMLYGKLNFKKTSAKDCEVNGTPKKCNGYVVTIDAATVKEWCDAYEAVLTKHYADLYQSFKIDLKDTFDTLRSASEDMEEFDIAVYLYKNQISEIRVEEETAIINFAFLGGTTPLQNMRITFGDAMEEYVIEKMGSIDGTIEKSELFVNNESFANWQYDYKQGDLTFAITSAGQNIFELAGQLVSDHKSMKFTISRLSVSGALVDITGTITMTEGAEVSKLPAETEVFHLGNATQDDFNKVIGEITTSNFFMSLLGSFLY